MPVSSTANRNSCAPEGPLSDQRIRIEKLAHAYSDPVARVTRIYLEEPSFCLGRQRDIEFEIKRIVASGLGVSYRSIAIAGSAQLGFSPHKGTIFTRGESDLDLAIIDVQLFQDLMETCISETRAFSDLQKFTNRGGEEAAGKLKQYITHKGMIPIYLMPLCQKVVRIEQLLSRAAAAGKGAFSSVNLAVYMSESLFCWKQNSGLKTLISRI